MTRVLLELPLFLRAGLIPCTAVWCGFHSRFGCVLAEGCRYLTFKKVGEHYL